MSEFHRVEGESAPTLPKYLYIDGYRWRVDLVDNWPMGHCRADSPVIEINNNLTQYHAHETLLHEILHAVSDHLEKDGVCNKIPEEIVDRMGILLFATLHQSGLWNTNHPTYQLEIPYRGIRESPKEWKSEDQLKSEALHKRMFHFEEVKDGGEDAKIQDSLSSR